MQRLTGGAHVAHAQTNENVDEARKYFETGVGYLDDPDGERVEEAYNAFRRAYDLSKSPKVLGNIGLCAMKLERDGEAIDAYSEYLRLPEIDSEERAQIEKDLRAMSTSVARITVTVDRPNTLVIDARTAVRGEAVTNAYGPVEGSMTIRMRQGHHVVRVKLEGVERGVWEFDAKPGDVFVHHFRVEPPRPIDVAPRTNRGVHPAAWLLTGVGTAALAAGAVTGIATNQAVAELERECPKNLCRAGYDLNGKRDSTQTLATLTNALLLGGGLMAAAGVTWLVVHAASAPSGNRERVRRDLPSVSAGAMCLPGACVATFGLRL